MLEERRQAEFKCFHRQVACGSDSVFLYEKTFLASFQFQTLLRKDKGSVMPLKLTTRLLRLVLIVIAVWGVTTGDAVTQDDASQMTVVTYRLVEETPAGTIIGNVMEDAHLDRYYPAGDMSQLRFGLFEEPSNRVTMTHVTIDDITSILRVKLPIDRDVICPGLETCLLPLGVVVGPSIHFLFVSVQIEVVDLNDQTPAFPVPVTSLTIPESVFPGSGFAIPAALDSDSPSNGVRKYVIVAGNADRKFNLTAPPTSGTLTLTVVDRLDREAVAAYHLNVTAVDGGDPGRSTSMLVDVTVGDVNDNPPVFTQSTWTAHLYENSTAGVWVIEVTVTDLDSLDSGMVTYQLTSVSPASGKSLFHLEEHSGNLTLARAELDRETVPSYAVTVTAVDMGVPSLSASTTVVIVIDDVNDNRPQVTVNTMTSDGVAMVTEGADPGTFVALVSATDADQGQNGNVSCDALEEEEVFRLTRVQPGRYKLVTRRYLDYENRSEYDVIIVCSDRGDDWQLTNRSVLHVRVADVNDNSPVFDHSTYNVTLAENNRIGANVTWLRATDLDSGENGHVTFSLIGEEAAILFRIDSETGSMRAGVSFDYETTPSVRVQVEARDHGSPVRYSITVVQVTISDVNDVAPTFGTGSYSFSVLENLPPNRTLGSVSAWDPEQGLNGIVTYSLSTSSLSTYSLSTYPLSTSGGDFCCSVDSKSGTLSTTRTLDRESRSVYVFTVVARDRGDPALTSTADVTVRIDDVNDNAPTIRFPSASENGTSVFVPDALVPGQNASRIIADDADDGLNAGLSFRFRPETEFFSVDAGSGIIRVAADLSRISHRIFDLVVHVTDLGDPPLSSSANLSIIVIHSSSSSSSSWSPSNGPLSTNSNLVVVVCVASVSGLAAILLLAAIFCIACRARSRHRRKLAQSGVSRDPTWSYGDPSGSTTVVRGGEEERDRWSYSHPSPTTAAKDSNRSKLHSEITATSGQDMITRIWTVDGDRESSSLDSGWGPSEVEHGSVLSDHHRSSFEKRNGYFSDVQRLSHPETHLSRSTTTNPLAGESSESIEIGPGDFRKKKILQQRPSSGKLTVSNSGKLLTTGGGQVIKHDRSTLDSRYGSSEMSDATSATSGIYVITRNDDVGKDGGEFCSSDAILV